MNKPTDLLKDRYYITLEIQTNTKYGKPEIRQIPMLKQRGQKPTLGDYAILLKNEFDTDFEIRDIIKMMYKPLDNNTSIIAVYIMRSVYDETYHRPQMASNLLSAKFK
ncbi:hypothetical protein ACFFK0_14690 [Paenibacillus chartarius]|uniref:Uncharacterized protein n=1 Tax=Paenibacillus chartarius TaxID=747481 RepID=A0ABV6DM17_9BACL